MDKRLWNLYLKEQEIEMDYFGQGEHRGYYVHTSTRGHMDNNQLKNNYYLWCERNLANVT